LSNEAITIVCTFHYISKVHIDSDLERYCLDTLGFDSEQLMVDALMKDFTERGTSSDLFGRYLTIIQQHHYLFSRRCRIRWFVCTRELVVDQL
jgi:hypothetical protein